MPPARPLLPLSVSLPELRSVLQAADEARRLRPDVPLALACLVAVDGSSYRQPGALMLCDAEGRVLAGAISGGCLEQDVALRAEAACANGAGEVVAYDLREDLESIWGFGMGCEGVAHVLLAPLPSVVPHLPRRRRRPHAAPAAPCSGWWRRQIARRSARCASWPPEARCTTTALRGVVSVVTRTEQAHLGAAAAGTTGERWFGSPVRPPVHLVVVGATRGAESMATVAAACGWPVTVVDHRPALLDALALPDGCARQVIDAAQAAVAMADGTLPTDPRTAFALCTHRFEHDLAWLRATLPSGVPYVGVLGSRQRAARLVNALTDAGQPLRARDRARLFAPIGLDVGGDAPEEIALAAVAEIQAVLHARPGGSLRERQTPLHTRTDTPALPAPAGPASCALPREQPRNRT